MNILVIILAFVLSFSNLFSNELEGPMESMLLLNMEDSFVLPEKFRMAPRQMTSDTQADPLILDGFTGMQASGSDQFSAESLKKILSTIPSEKVLIIDLREESHGFINGMAVGWYGCNYNWENKDKPLNEIEEDESQRLANLLKKGSADIYLDKTFQYTTTVSVEEVFTEKSLAYSLGAEYARIPVSDHAKPSDLSVEMFVEIIKAHTKDTWYHIHCSGGKGKIDHIPGHVRHDAQCL